MGAFVIFLRSTNDLHTTTSNPLHFSFNLNCYFSYSSDHHANTNINHNRSVLSALPVSDLGRIYARGSTKHVPFNPTMISLLPVSLKHSPHPSNYQSIYLHSNEPLSALGIYIFFF